MKHRIRKGKGNACGTRSEQRRFCKQLLRTPRRDGRPKAPPREDLRAGRPELTDRAGLPCEACDAETSADAIVFLDGDALCPACARWRRSLTRAAGLGAAAVAGAVQGPIE